MTYDAGYSGEPVVHTSMPPECYHLEKNPIYTKLQDKRDQLREASEETRKLVFLVDAGAKLLKQIGEPRFEEKFGDRVSGSDIIDHFLKKYGDDIHCVVVLSPRELKSYALLGPLAPPDESPHWRLTCFTSSLSETEINCIEKLSNHLPRPMRNAFSARQAGQNGHFNSNSQASYRGCRIYYQKEPYMKQISFSTGALRDLILGNMSGEDFRKLHIGDSALSIINDKETISSISFESSGEEHDDDFVVLSFLEDPSVAKYK